MGRLGFSCSRRLQPAPAQAEAYAPDHVAGRPRGATKAAIGRPIYPNDLVGCALPTRATDHRLEACAFLPYLLVGSARPTLLCSLLPLF